ncbi:MAG: heavy metal-responsive transcriptional regulator [Acidimicrobiales bacterium]
MRQLTVSKLAEQAGTSADTVRYYERIGLLPETERSPSGYRLYGDEAVERLRFIKQAQRFGLRLEAIGELLDVRRRGLCPCGHTRRMLADRVAELDEEMSSLARLRADIATMIDELPASGTTGASWQCSSELIQIGPPNPFGGRLTDNPSTTTTKEMQ